MSLCSSVKKHKTASYVLMFFCLKKHETASYVLPSFRGQAFPLCKGSGRTRGEQENLEKGVTDL